MYLPFTPDQIHKVSRKLKKKKKAIGPDVVYSEYIKCRADQYFASIPIYLIKQLTLEVIQKISN